MTGGAGGIGRAIVARLSAEGYEVEPLDLVDGFDVSDPGAWEAVGPVDVACLNAGVLTGEVELRSLSDEQYRRALGVNIDGVVFGVRRLARVMEKGSIVVTASLAGLTGMPSDAIYSLTKHALVGFVRSVAPQLEPVTVNAVCPGIADTPMIDAPARRVRGHGLPARRARRRRRRRLARCDERADRGGVVRAAGARAGDVPLPDLARPAPGRRASRAAAAQLSPGSYGMLLISETEPPARATASRHSASGSSANGSVGSAGTTIQAGSSSSASSWPAPQPGVAREQPDALDRQRLGLGVGTHEADAVEDRRNAVLDVVELGEHHERLRLDRAADEDGSLRAGQPFEQRHRLGGAHVRGAAEHQAHRAVLVVVGDQDDGLAEVRIDEGGRRQEQVSAQGLHLK